MFHSTLRFLRRKPALTRAAWTRVLRPLEGHNSTLWVLYWPNEIVKWFGTLFPLLVLGFVRVHFDKAPEKRDAMFLLAWLAVPGLLFTFTATK